MNKLRTAAVFAAGAATFGASASANAAEIQGFEAKGGAEALVSGQYKTTGTSSVEVVNGGQPFAGVATFDQCASVALSSEGDGSSTTFGTKISLVDGKISSAWGRGSLETDLKEVSVPSEAGNLACLGVRTVERELLVGRTTKDMRVVLSHTIRGNAGVESVRTRNGINILDLCKPKKGTPGIRAEDRTLVVYKEGNQVSSPVETSHKFYGGQRASCKKK